MDVKAELGFLGSFDVLPMSVLKVLEVAGRLGAAGTAEALVDVAWDLVVDPTSFIDPNPQQGPFL
jgi:hypothetical protein